jgi:acyl-[acyl-carrier protein] desaturase
MLAGPAEKRLYRAYRDFFAAAEEHRRWNVDRDVPWSAARRDGGVPDHLVGVIESFFAVELYLPDYVGRIIGLLRESRGRAWFQANWGYEESKHSLALEEWLVRSGSRTEEQLADFAGKCLEQPWPLTYAEPRKMLAYQMVQELATAVNYRHLREACEPSGDEALLALLRFIMIDERAHYQFFRDAFKVLLDEDRAGATADLYQVLGEFEMPAQRQIPEYERRGPAIEAAGVFSGRIFVREVVFPIYQALGVAPRAQVQRKVS